MKPKKQLRSLKCKIRIHDRTLRCEPLMKNSDSAVYLSDFDTHSRMYLVTNKLLVTLGW